MRRAGKTTLYSRRQNVLNQKFSYIAAAMEYLPNGTVLDRELVALGPEGKPDFNLLQSFRSAKSHIRYYAFDILLFENRNLTQLPLSERRVLLRSVLEPHEPISLSQVDNRSAAEMLRFAKKHELEGAIAKRSDSIYEPGRRSGLWVKHRINLGQEFVIGGYVPGHPGIDALVVGFYRGKDLIYAARVRAGLVPATRRAVLEKINHLNTLTAPSLICPSLRPVDGARDLRPRRCGSAFGLNPKQLPESNSWSGVEPIIYGTPNLPAYVTTKTRGKSSKRPRADK